MSISRRESLSIIAGASVASLVSPSLIYADEVGVANSKVFATEEMAGLISREIGEIRSQAKGLGLSNVAIIYDRTTAYLCREDESSYTPLVTYPQFPERGGVDTTIAPNISPSSSTHSVPIPSSPIARASNYSLSVPIVRQPSGSSMRWAARPLPSRYTTKLRRRSMTRTTSWQRPRMCSQFPIGSLQSTRTMQALGPSHTHYDSAPSLLRIALMACGGRGAPAPVLRRTLRQRRVDTRTVQKCIGS